MFDFAPELYSSQKHLLWKYQYTYINNDLFLILVVHLHHITLREIFMGSQILYFTVAVELLLMVM